MGRESEGYQQNSERYDWRLRDVISKSGLGQITEGRVLNSSLTMTKEIKSVLKKTDRKEETKPSPDSQNVANEFLFRPNNISSKQTFYIYEDFADTKKGKKITKISRGLPVFGF